MSEFRKEHLLELMKNLSGEFFTRESNLTSMITVTRIEISDDSKSAKVFISVFPEKREVEALHFAKRQLTDLREFILKRIKTNRIPFMTIEIDQGEKLRNKMDSVL